MIPLKLRIKNIGPYVDETIDFSSIDGDVVAIVGENGSGKTMLMDSVFASLYRSLPSRDSIYKYCRGKDAGLEFDFKGDFGIQYRTEIKINARSREMESWIFQSTGDGQFAALTDGKNSTFDRKVEELFGPAGVALASTFASQNKAGSFLSLPKAKRKELFIDLLGLGKLQTISGLADGMQNEAAEEYNRLHKQIEDLKPLANVVDIEWMKDKLETLRAEVAASEDVIKAKSSVVAELKIKSASVNDVINKMAPLEKRRVQLEKDYKETSSAIKNAEELTTKIGSYRMLAEQLDKTTEELEVLRIKAGEISKDISEYRDKLAQYNTNVGTYKLALAEHTSNKASAEKELTRAKRDSAVINSVPCHAEGECADCQFLVHAIEEKEAIVDYEAKIDEAKASILNLEALIKAQIRPDAEQFNALQSALVGIQESIKDREGKIVLCNAAKNKVASAQASIDLLVDLEKRRARIEADQMEVAAMIQAVVEEVTKAKAAIDQYTAANNALELERENLSGTNLELTKFLADITRAEVQNEQAVRVKDEIAALEPKAIQADRDRRSWSLLAKAFSKTGIQSLEIDAAGPAVSEITNNLLFDCFGPRFSVRFVTQVLKDDKSGYKDDFDIYVTDSQSGVEGSIDDLSGGEKTIVCEAVSLAISLFNRSRSATGWQSLWRDEATSAVDDVRAPLYIAMLRKARELGHFLKLYFIAHQQRVTENADSKIKVDSGHVTFE